MRTTLNIPNPLIKHAKRRALEKGKTLIDLLGAGLRARLARALPPRSPRVSSTGGGLLPGVEWRLLEPAEPTAEEYR